MREIASGLRSRSARFGGAGWVELLFSLVLAVRASGGEEENLTVLPPERGRAALREYLLAHKLLTGRREGLVFGKDGETPFGCSSLRARARDSWSKAEEPLDPIGLHEARHTCASLMIAAGVNAKAITTYMGHSSITITFDLYGHLMPGSEDEAAGLLDVYLAGAAEVRA